jgi:ABC-type spermidine/putrescine transport system permease subunit I
MKDYFLSQDKRYRPYNERFKYSLIINSISTAIGIPGNYLLNRKIEIDHLSQIVLLVLLNFIFTLVIEFISAKILIKPALKNNRLVEFEIKSNLASYALIFGIPFVYSFIAMWISV